VFPIVLAVSEDWAPGGAGNGLGTLYAYEKACRLAKSKHGIDMEQMMSEGKISAALYHTAGKGTRLAPLPASENNNKPGVKLPYSQKLVDGTYEPLTVLEAVVKQTAVYASSRKGRLSVYWGDQIFIPTKPFVYSPSHHIDIMCTLLGETAPTAEEWVEQGLDKYGVIAVSKGASKDAAQVEKVDHATAVRMLKSLGDIGQVGPSLGSFSVSSLILTSLCAEYRAELDKKEGKFDTDPHFWMPLTLPSDEYTALMKQKGIEESVSVAHHVRMSAMKSKLQLGNLGLFGAVDVGKDACWWDYGLLKLYSTNNIKLTEQDENAELLRTYFGITSLQENSTLGEGVKVDDVSTVFSSEIRSSSNIAQSALCNVNAISVEAEGAIIVNCTARKIVAKKGAILYNLIDDTPEGIIAEEGDVMVSVTQEDGTSMTVKSHINICGGKKWKEIVKDNSLSFEDVMKKNANSNIGKIENVRKVKAQKVADSF